MPDFPIVDAHLHLWDPTAMRMLWIAGDPLLDRVYGLADYREHTAGIDIAAMVYVQVEVEPVYALLEARWAHRRAAADPRLGAIVAHAPLAHGATIRTYLDELVRVGPLVRGVRQVTQGEPDPDYVAQPRFVEAARILPAYGLTCDLCVKHPQLPAVIALVRQCPDTAFILDHIGKPDIAAGLLEPWRDQIRALAELPNVRCKLSGMVSEADVRRWTADDLRPYVETVLAAFGEDRVLFGGDWPVVLGASTYRRWVETLDQLTGGLTATQRRKLWADNARTYYRLP